MNGNYPYDCYSQQNRARTLLLYLGFMHMRSERDKYKVKPKNRDRLNEMGARITGIV